MTKKRKRHITWKVDLKNVYDFTVCTIYYIKNRCCSSFYIIYATKQEYSKNSNSFLPIYLSDVKNYFGDAWYSFDKTSVVFRIPSKNVYEVQTQSWINVAFKATWIDKLSRKYGFFSRTRKNIFAIKNHLLMDSLP